MEESHIIWKSSRSLDKNHRLFSMLGFDDRASGSLLNLLLKCLNFVDFEGIVCVEKSIILSKSILRLYTRIVYQLRWIMKCYFSLFLQEKREMYKKWIVCYQCQSNDKTLIQEITILSVCLWIGLKYEISTSLLLNLVTLFIQLIFNYS